ncbi:uncharacterized protein LTR77_005045 [Saxophila tyrrhenica]|uniref:Uncharacterized protein n=1 Tax=Saxophila tyrrhenica TaxID=1690608 RepID=A0AAV9PAX1_9PEZI|nr:hypothetical protein LTR77_005045 [Saxophila tyrrhenica]
MVCLRTCVLAAGVIALNAVNAAPYERALPPVPIAIGGKEASISEEFIELMKPDYDVVHVINSAPVGKSEFIPLLKGEYTIPVTMLGSNFNNPNPKVPKAIFIGGGFAQSEIDEMYNVCSLQVVPWVYPPAGRSNGTVVPPTSFIAERVKAVFKENG